MVHSAPILLSSPESVSSLPWAGNYAADAHLFTACADYARSLVVAGDRDSARRVIFLMGLHGMGIDSPVTDAELDSVVSGY